MMLTKNKLSSLKGIIPPLVTPLTSQGVLDLKSTHKLIDHLIDGGVHGIFILGTTGEAASLSLEQRLYIIEEVLVYVNKRLPVLVGVTDSSEEVTMKLVEKAKEYGADAVVSAPPFYYGLGQAELIHYYKVLADKSSLPVFLYNMPSNTKIHFEIDSVIELSKHENIIGFKDSSGDSKYFQKVIHHFKDKPAFLLHVGSEEYLAATVLMGGSGGICGGANLFPRLYVELYEQAVAKNIEEVLRLQDIVMEISNNIYTVGKYQSSYLKGLKAALSVLGMCENQLASPLQAFETLERNKIKERLESIQNRFFTEVNSK